MLVRSLLALGLVAAAVAAGPATANAKPRLPINEPHELDICPRGKWPAVQRCLEKAFRRSKARIEVAFDNGKMKVVTATVSADDRQLIVYTFSDSEWFRTTLTLRSSSAWEVLGIEAFQTPSGEGVRIDAGSASRTTFMLSRGSFARGVLRRRMTHVCFPGVVSCRVFPTACEAYARGKVYWTFRAELVMHATLGLRLRGDPRASGSVCRPSKTTLLEPE